MQNEIADLKAKDDAHSPAERYSKFTFKFVGKFSAQSASEIELNL